MKNIKPTYVVDITSCQTVNDVICEFVYAKVEAGLPITMLEYKISTENFINNYKTAEEMIHECFDTAVNEVSTIVDKLHETYTKQNNTEVKKPNMFKRFWNWITNKK
ncbi:hypothetical protein [uncultured phage cr130_1]|uniref:Uncharacterized protein n=1 Tax=uncultured phage cr130_1 TaxID=2772092 RepID=A0A7M1RXC6_9CAUD|nr:hypothetical protein KNV59_gp45 [uncultured phage cr130_1]QOR57660.1 hypothetical protein [uncultured phage cr130_1]